MAGGRSSIFPVSSLIFSPFLSLLSFCFSLPISHPSILSQVFFSPSFFIFSHPCLSLSSDFHTFSLIFLFSSFLSSGLPSHCSHSLFPYISSILTPLMTLRSFHPADYAKGFGGQYGIQKDRVDKVKHQNTSVLRMVP